MRNSLKDQLSSNDKAPLKSGSANREVVKIGIVMSNKVVFIEIANILYCEASGAYTNIFFCDGKKLVASKSLGYFETQLFSRKFFRIHHSFLINLSRIKEVQKQHGRTVIMENNRKFEVSQRKRRVFNNAMENFML